MYVKGRFSNAWKILLILTSMMVVSKSFKIIVLSGNCDAPVTNLLHLIRRSVGEPFFQEVDHNQGAVHFKNKEAKTLRHDISDACHWVSEGSIAIFAVTGKSFNWEGIDTTAHNYNLPHLVTPDPCMYTCATPPFENKPWQREIAVFEYLKKEYLHHVIVIQEGNDEGGTLLSSLLASHGVRVSHIRAGGVSDGELSFLRNVERFFEAWNLADLTDNGRMLISLGDGEVADTLILKMLSSSMHKMRTKVLVSDSPVRWQERLLEVRAYEVDLTLVSRIGARAADCPAAFEVMSTRSQDHKMDANCSALSLNDKTIGETILRNVQENLRVRRCCGVDEYTVWRSFPAENGTQRLRPVAVWANDTGLLRMEPLHLDPLHLRIAVVQYRPFVVFNVTNGEVVLDDCVLKEIIGYVSGRLHFRFSFVMAPDDDWGTKSGNDWNGAIGMVLRGEADVIPYLTITPTRYEAVEYTKPLTSVTYGLLIAFPEEPPRALIFLRLYKTEVWLLLFLSALFLSYVLCKIHSFSWSFRKPEDTQKSLRSFFRCLWLIFGIMLQQGGTHLPVTTSGRLLLATWWLSVMVITTTYSANLIAFLAFPDIRFVVETLQDLAEHKTIALAIKEGCPVLEDFEHSQVEVYRRIREVYLQGNKKRRRIVRLSTHTPRCCAVEEVAQGSAVYVDDLNYLEWMVEDDFWAQGGRCRVTIAPTSFSQMDLAVGLRRGSSLVNLFNDEIQRMKESGVLQHWKEKFSPQRDECYSIDASLPGQREVSLEDLQGPFYLLAMGLVAGVLFFALETAWHRHKSYRSKLQSDKTRYRLPFLREWKLNQHIIY